MKTLVACCALTLGLAMSLPANPISHNSAPPASAKATPAKIFFQNLKDGKKQTVVIYGTSLSAGGAWAKATEEWFAAQYPGLVTVINSSMSGRNSEQGVENLKTRVLTKQPNLVFMEFSYNDCVDRFNLPVERAAENLDKMVKAIQEQDPTTAIVLQVMNVPWDATNGKRSSSIRANLEKYNDNYRACAKAHGLTLLDHYPNWLRLKETNPEQFQAWVADGTHPIKEGSLTVTWPTVKAWLEKRGEP